MIDLAHISRSVVEDVGSIVFLVEMGGELLRTVGGSSVNPIPVFPFHYEIAKSNLFQPDLYILADYGKERFVFYPINNL